jgi:nitroimidazol reductase NimA-like FMN-containing flavoprotein (pyridoxamine 5'-phosphate oxidase superfamily)
MADDPAGRVRGSSPASPDPRSDPTIWDPEVERLDEAECLRLISPGGVGRLGYSGRHGVAVLPVSYRLSEDSIVFRTPLDSPTDEDLRTGIQGAEYKVSFEIDEYTQNADEGWMVFMQGDAHHIESEDDRASAWPRDVQPSGSAREHFLRITPTAITGRRLRRR